MEHVNVGPDGVLSGIASSSPEMNNVGRIQQESIGIFTVLALGQCADRMGVGNMNVPVLIIGGLISGIGFGLYRRQRSGDTSNLLGNKDNKFHR